MTNAQLNIPKKIHVGYQNRNGTYTKKLAYVIYTDEKGKKRKETSWQSWRDKGIDPDDFDNEPQSGFVLNKGVGGTRGSWSSNTRNEYIRVYDPRGFEFEISVANLLFVLTECNAFKGKGLEGEFVYAWGGTELVLLPVSCSEYKESAEFTSLKTMKVTKKDMKEGLTYQHKDTRELVYLGRHKIRDLDRYWWYGEDKPNPLLHDPTKFTHVFYDTESKDWHFEKGFTKLARIISEESHPDFADLYSKFEASKYVSEFDKIILEPVTAEKVCRRHGGHWFFIKIDEGYQLVEHGSYNPNGSYRYGQEDLPDKHGMTREHFWPLDPIIVKTVDQGALAKQYTQYYNECYGSRYSRRGNQHVSRSYIKDKKLFTPKIQLKSNEKLGLSNYVK